MLAGSNVPSEDVIFSKLESIKAVIEAVNAQFQDAVRGSPVPNGIAFIQFGLLLYLSECGFCVFFLVWCRI